MKHIGAWFPIVKDVAMGDTFMVINDHMEDKFVVYDITMEPVSGDPNERVYKPWIWAQNKTTSRDLCLSPDEFFAKAEMQDKSTRNPDAEVLNYADWNC
jgi:hypothetical protein